MRWLELMLEITGVRTSCLIKGKQVCKKKIDKSIDFLRGWEEKMVSIFCLRRCEEVELSLGPNVAHSDIYT